MKAKTGAERVAANAERKKAQGLVKVSVSAWVPADRAEQCRLAAKRAIEKAKGEQPKADRD